MRIAKLKLTALVLAASGFLALVGVGTVAALNRPGTEKKTPPAPGGSAAGKPADPPIEGNWTPGRIIGLRYPPKAPGKRG